MDNDPIDIDIDIDEIDREGQTESGYDNPMLRENAKKAMVRITCAGTKGSGFFFLFPYRGRLIKTIITNEHVITIGAINSCQNVKFEPYVGGKLSLKLEKTKRTIGYFSHEVKHDCTLIEIFDSDPIPKEVVFLEIHPNYMDDKFYLYKSIWLFQYPGKFEGELKAATGCVCKYDAVKNIIAHNASSDHGSSGGVILFGSECNAIGLHRGGSRKNEGTNFGSLLGPIIKEVEIDDKSFWNITNISK